MERVVSDVESFEQSVDGEAPNHSDGGGQLANQREVKKDTRRHFPIPKWKDSIHDRSCLVRAAPSNSPAKLLSTVIAHEE
jgi:hypothetical protein